MKFFPKQVWPIVEGKNMNQFTRFLKTNIRRIFLAAICGVTAGIASAAFLSLLKWATDFRMSHRESLWALPIAGFMIGLSYYYFGSRISRGNSLILDEIHDPQNTLPARMGPMVLASTVLTHLCGGSSGREGTAVQLGASFAEQIGRLFKVNVVERRSLLIAGMGAGFGSSIGAPLAGMIFGIEVVTQGGRLHAFALLESLVASLIAFETVKLLGIQHSHFPLFTYNIEFTPVLLTAISGVLFGLASRGFIGLTHVFETIYQKIVPYSPLRGLIGGALLLIYFNYDSSGRFEGLGLEVIQNSFTQMTSFHDPFIKALLTALTLSSGFKGGEFIPLVFIGTSLGSALGAAFPAYFSLLASVGFAAVFAGAAKAPLACTLMAAEIFGSKILPYALIACFVSHVFSGDLGIYKISRKKMKHTI